MHTVKFELGWNGKPMFGTHEKPLCLDTETDLKAMTDPSAINTLALFQVSDGTRTFLGHPDSLVSFLNSHQHIPLVGHNFSFDFHVIENYLKINGYEKERLEWWERIDKGLVHDTMVLDMLIRLGEGSTFTNDDSKFYQRGLGEVSKEYCGIILNKEDPYRMRYNEIIGKKFSEVTDTAFWTYAAKDAYANVMTWIPMYKKAIQLMQKYANGLGGDTKKRMSDWLSYGPLTELIQIKGMISLAQIERDGFPFSDEEAAKDELRFRPTVDSRVKELDKLAPMLFKKKYGKFEMNKKSRTPMIHDNELFNELAKAGVKIKEKIPEFLPPQSCGKKFQEKGEAISKSPFDWEVYGVYDPFISAWVELAKCVKRLGLYDKFRSKEKDLFSEFDAVEEEKVIRSRYKFLMTTGRTSANCQQYPRDPDFRKIFCVPPGEKLLTIDYSAIELRTLAATCINRFGYSVLGDVIKAGVDPHSKTAAMLNGIDLADFMAMKKSDTDKFKEMRQAAKALNFGVPGGLGALRLVEYAALNYNVNLSIKDAKSFRDKLINEIYPELNDRDGYLADDTIQSMAFATGIDKGWFKTNLPGENVMKHWIGKVLTRIASGATTKTNGEGYDSDFFEKCWDFLEQIAYVAPKGILSEESRKKLKLRTGDMFLSKELTAGVGLTLTGRIRGKVRYTEAKNTPFQGLASDGGKCALYRLTKMGFTICAFIHDEFVVRLKEKDADVQAKIVDKIVCEEMEAVMGHVLPVSTEYNIESYWVK